MTARRRFRVPHLPDAPDTLAAAPAHHLLHVLRLGVGARVIVFDGHGLQREVEVSAIEAGQVRVIPVGEVHRTAPATPAHLLLASPKPKALEVALRMAVETGVTHIDVFPAQRSLNRPPRLDRWTRLAEAAAQQCGRADLPTLQASSSLDAALLAATERSLALFIALPGASRLPAPSRPSAVLIGPEGGFDPREVQRCIEAGAAPMGLGDWVLRADTAAAIASAWVSSVPLQ